MSPRPPVGCIAHQYPVWRWHPVRRLTRLIQIQEQQKQQQNKEQQPAVQISSAISIVTQPTMPAQKSSSAISENLPTHNVTPLQLVLGAIILGASAGLTLYTKLKGVLLAQLERASQNATRRRGRRKYGPTTKLKWERTRSRVSLRHNTGAVVWICNLYQPWPHFSKCLNSKSVGEG